ncbi:MAG: AAA family ATPase, partial [Anaerotignaceae bacterium]
HTIIPKVEQLLSLNIKKEIAPREPAFRKTTVSTIVMDLIAYSHIQRKIGVVYGDAGIGKTMGINAYREENPDTSIVITISPCFATMTGVNELMAEELRIREKVSRKIQTEVIKKLRGSNKVLIIDEAQHLTVRVINHLRCIADESGIGMALIGNEEIYLKMRSSGQASYAQLYSRIANNKHVLTSLISKNDIELIFEESFLESDAIEILFKISRTNYGLRGAVNVFVNTAAVFGEVTAKGIARMAKEMNIA